MKTSFLNNFILVLTEILFGSLLICLLYTITGHSFSLWSLYAILVPAAVLFLWLLEKEQNKANTLYLVTVLPYMLVAGSLLGFSFVLLLILSIVLFWRTTVNVKNSDSEQTGFWLLMSFLLGTILLFVAQLETTADSTQVVTILILQLAVFLIGGFIRRLLPVETELKEKSQFTKYFLFIIGGITGVSVMLTAGMNILKQVFFLILEGVSKTAAILASPLFMWSEGKKMEAELQSLPENMNLEGESFLDESKDSAAEAFDPTFLFTILIIAACFILFYIIMKKSKSLAANPVSENPSFTISSTYDEAGDKDKFYWIPPIPDHVIRKEIHQFEKFAAKLHLGRNDFEAINEWFKRIGVPENKELVSIYEKVRYGDEEGTQKEYKLFKELITAKKTELKKIHKQLEKEGKLPSKSLTKAIISKFSSKKK